MQPLPNVPMGEGKAPKASRERIIYEQVKRFLDFILSDPFEELSEIADANKRKICGEILSDVAENLEKREPILSVRRRLGNYATLTARDEVLVKTPDMAGFKGITGELGPGSRNLPPSIPASGSFSAGERKPRGPSGPWRTFCAQGPSSSTSGRAPTMWVRMELGDWDKDKRLDWFAPNKVAQMVVCEQAYRKELGMPSTLAAPREEGGSGELIAYGEFEKVVLEGHRQPRLVWEDRWEAMLGYPNPLKGLEL